MSGSREIHELAALITTSMPGFMRAMHRAADVTEGLARSWINAAQKIDVAVTRIATGVATVTTAIATGVAKMGIDFLALQQRAEISFTTIFKSAERAKQMMADLTEFARTTPFELPQVIEYAQRLLAMGVAAHKVIPYLRTLGDATAALGGSPEKLNRIITAIGQIQAKGKLSAEEMLQLAEAGVPAWQMLADVLGTDIPTAMKRVEQGTVQAADVMDAFIDQIRKRFGGGMEAQSKRWDGLWSNMVDTVRQASAKIFEPLFAALEQGLAQVNRFLDSTGFTEWLQRMRMAVAGLVFELQRLADTNAGPIVRALGDYFIWAADAAARFVRMLNSNSATIRKHASYWLELIRTIGKFLTQHTELVAAFMVFKTGQFLGINAAIGSITTAVGGLIVELAKLKTGAEGAEMALLKLKMVGFAAATAGIIWFASKVYEAHPDIRKLREEMEKTLDLDEKLAKIMERRDTRFFADVNSLTPDSKAQVLKAELEQAKVNLQGAQKGRVNAEKAVQARVQQVRTAGNDPESWYAKFREATNLADASEFLDEWGLEFGGAVGQTIRKDLEEAIASEQRAADRVARLNAELATAQTEMAQMQQQTAEQVAQATSSDGGSGTPATPIRSDRIDELLAQQQQQAIDDRAPGYGAARDFLGLDGVTGDDALRFGLNVPGATPEMANQLASDVDSAGGDPSALDAAALRFAMAINQAKAAMEAHTAAVEQSAERQKQAREAIEAGSERMTDASTRLRDAFGGMSGLDPIVSSMNTRFQELASQLQSGSINVDQFNREVSETAQAANAAAEAERRRKILAGDFAGAGFSVQQGLEDRMIRYREQQFQQGLDAMFNQMIGLGGAVQPVIGGFQQLYGGMQQFGQSLMNVGGQVAGGVEQAFGMLSSMMNSKEGAIANLMNQIAMLEQNLQMVDNPFSQQRIMNDIAGFQAELNDLLREAPPVLTESPSGPIDPALQGGMTQSFSISLPNVNKFTSSDASILYDAIEREARRRGTSLG